MSTPGAAYDAPLAQRQYFCYPCNRKVLIAASAAAAGELFCPDCRAGAAFLEEVTVATPSIYSFPFVLTPAASFPPGSSSSSTAAPPSSNLCNFITSFLDLQDGRRARSRSGSGASSSAGTATPEHEAESFDPLLFFQTYIRGLEEGGANIQVLLDGLRVDLLPDYVDGPALELLMEHIAENHPNRRGTPPASKSALSMLPDVVLTNDIFESAEGAECVVCKEDFSPGDEAKKLPCNHIYHAKCIISWLGLHGSCPICRFELPTDEPDDEGNLI